MSICCIDNGLDVNYSPREPMVQESAVQTSDGNLMSAGLQIALRCSFLDPEGSHLHIDH
jgi:hypothetical protein